MMIAACLAPADEDLLFCTPSQILNPKVKGLIQPAQSGQPDLDRNAPHHVSPSGQEEDFFHGKIAHLSILPPLVRRMSRRSHKNYDAQKKLHRDLRRYNLGGT